MSKTAPLYLVSGLPRSGTSLMMQMLHRGGLEVLTDEIRSADDDNPRGYFELEEVKQSTAWIERAPGKVVKLISKLLIELPEGMHRYKVIFMRRDLDEVLASQRTMLERRGEALPADQADADREMKELFVAHLEEVEAWLRARGDVEVLFVSYNRLVAEPRATVERVNRFLDHVLDTDAMTAAVDGSLYRNRKPG